MNWKEQILEQTKNEPLAEVFKNRDMKNQITLTQEVYSYGKCNCCNKRFTRKIRGVVLGYLSGNYYEPVNFYDSDTEKEYYFSNTPKDIILVKVGFNCRQNILTK